MGFQRNRGAGRATAPGRCIAIGGSSSLGTGKENGRRSLEGCWAETTRRSSPHLRRSLALLPEQRSRCCRTWRFSDRPASRRSSSTTSRYRTMDARQLS